jgi:hypothetical protein
MRHERVHIRESFDVVDAAAIWPHAGAPISLAIGELDQRPTPAVPDMPVAVGRAIVCLYSALIIIFFLTMGFGGEARFMIAISGLYLAMFLGVPSVFLRVEADPSRRPSMAGFMARGIQTHTGPMSGRSALAQIFVVPALLTLGILAIGLAALWMLP